MGKQLTELMDMLRVGDQERFLKQFPTYLNSDPSILNAKDEASGNTLLHMAVFYSLRDVFNFLYLQDGIITDPVNNAGKQPSDMTTDFDLKDALSAKQISELTPHSYGYSHQIAPNTIFFLPPGAHTEYFSASQSSEAEDEVGKAVNIFGLDMDWYSGNKTYRIGDLKITRSTLSDDHRYTVTILNIRNLDESKRHQVSNVFAIEDHELSGVMCVSPKPDSGDIWSAEFSEFADAFKIFNELKCLLELDPQDCNIDIVINSYLKYLYRPNTDTPCVIKICELDTFLCGAERYELDQKLEPIKAEVHRFNYLEFDAQSQTYQLYLNDNNFATTVLSELENWHIDQDYQNPYSDSSTSMSCSPTTGRLIY